MDGFVHGEEIKFVEYNAENPSSLSDQEGLNRVLFELPEMSTFAARYRLRQFSPMQKLLETLLETYKEWGGAGPPNIAIIDWNNLPTANEFVLLRNHFVSHGVRTVICSPADLTYEKGKLRCGDFPIDLAYKRVIIHELLANPAQAEPIVRAYRDRAVCLVNPFRCKIVHKKASFELLTDEAHQGWFGADELDAIRRCVPWTRRLSDRLTTRQGRKVELLKFVRQERDRLVLKPNDDYGGHGLYLGARLSEGEWDEAIMTAPARGFCRAGGGRFVPGRVSCFQRKRVELAANVCRYESLSLPRRGLWRDGPFIAFARRERHLRGRRSRILCPRAGRRHLGARRKLTLRGEKIGKQDQLDASNVSFA